MIVKQRKVTWFLREAWKNAFSLPKCFRGYWYKRTPDGGHVQIKFAKFINSWKHHLFSCVLSDLTVCCANYHCRLDMSRKVPPEVTRLCEVPGSDSVAAGDVWACEKDQARSMSPGLRKMNLSQHHRPRAKPVMAAIRSGLSQGGLVCTTCSGRGNLTIMFHH